MGNPTASLSYDEIKNIEKVFYSFVEKENLFFKSNAGYPWGVNETYEINVSKIEGVIPPESFQQSLMVRYLWGNEQKQEYGNNSFDFRGCNFSFYFKFIKDCQKDFSHKETAILLNNKLFASKFDVFNVLVDLNNHDVNDCFFTTKFLLSNLDLFVENYRRFSFSPEQERGVFEKLEKSVQFKKDVFRNKVYRMIRNEFNNPNDYNDKFPDVLMLGKPNIFTASNVQSLIIEIDKVNISNFNLMRNYTVKDIYFLIDLVIGKINDIKDDFGISGCSNMPDKSDYQKIKICFFGNDDKGLNVTLLQNVFNKFVLSVLSENEMAGAIVQIKGGTVLEKIMLEEYLPEPSSLNNKKMKI